MRSINLPLLTHLIPGVEAEVKIIFFSECGHFANEIEGYEEENNMQAKR